MHINSLLINTNIIYSIAMYIFICVYVQCACIVIQTVYDFLPSTLHIVDPELCPIPLTSSICSFSTCSLNTFRIHIMQHILYLYMHGPVRRTHTINSIHSVELFSIPNGYKMASTIWQKALVHTYSYTRRFVPLCYQIKQMNSMLQYMWINTYAYVFAVCYP